MAMSASMHKALKEALGDSKHNEDKLIDLVKNHYDGFEAMTKVQKANDDISKERDDLKDKVKSLNEDKTKSEKSISDKDKEIEKIKADSLTPEQKAEFLKMQDKGMSSDVEAKFNRMEQDRKSDSEKLETLVKELSEEKAGRIIANRNEFETKTKSDIQKALNDAKITKSNNVSMAILLAKDLGLYKINEKDGGYESSYFTKDEKGGALSANVKEMADYIAKNNLGLVESSGNGGTGTDHSSNNNRGTDTKTGSLQATQESAADMMAKHRK